MEQVFVLADISFRETSVSHPSRDFVWTIEGEGYAFFAKLLLPFCTILAVLTGLYNTSDSNEVSNLKSRNLISNSSYSPNNFVSWDKWKYGVSSIIFDSVKIGVTNSTVKHFKCEILRSECSTSNF